MVNISLFISYRLVALVLEKQTATPVLILGSGTAMGTMEDLDLGSHLVGLVVAVEATVVALEAVSTMASIIIMICVHYSPPL